MIDTTDRPQFLAADGSRAIPAVSADEMREVDRLAVEVFQLGVLQMMENAGRSLALQASEMAGRRPFRAAILVGPGGNGGGGLSCARHLHNHGVEAAYVLAQPPEEMRSAAVNQLRTLQTAGLKPVSEPDAARVISQADVVIDALLGYGLSGAPRRRVADLIQLANASGKAVLALDLPSGLNATSGDHPGQVIHPARTLTLALPKLGLRDVEGRLFLADIGIPPELFGKLGIQTPPLFNGQYAFELDPSKSEA
jgi:NAD(P)H-hydrate epimerase